MQRTLLIAIVGVMMFAGQSRADWVDADAPRAKESFDGEIDNGHWLNYEFVLQFEGTCRLAIPGEASDAIRVLRCRRKGSDIQCTVRSATTMDEVFSSIPSLRAFRAPISKDTPQALVFATPAGKLSFKVDLRAGKATLSQAKAASCTGYRYTYDEFRAMAKAYRDKHPRQAEPEAEPSQPSASSGSRPSLTKPRGAERGRMCSRPSDCASGSCKMENKTRGRCQ